MLERFYEGLLNITFIVIHFQEDRGISEFGMTLAKFHCRNVYFTVSKHFNRAVCLCNPRILVGNVKTNGLNIYII